MTQKGLPRGRTGRNTARVELSYRTRKGGRSLFYDLIAARFPRFLMTAFRAMPVASDGPLRTRGLETNCEHVLPVSEPLTMKAEPQFPSIKVRLANVVPPGTANAAALGVTTPTRRDGRHMTGLPTRASRHQQAMRILAEALDQPAEKRGGFVASVCGGDVSLARSIESLLLHADRDYSPGDDVARAAQQVLRLADTINFEGRQLAGWQVAERIGVGGMGAVYRARRTVGEEQHEQAAIKILRNSVASDDALRRFRAEQRILARIRHPNIARLIEAGTTEEGLPYLVMDYVDGEPLDEYCDRRHLTIVQRISLFRQLCLAVQQAHDRHIVHRDLKPANVLVDRDGSVRLLDFGIAKLLAPEVLDCSIQMTAEFERLMTPAFASPEQVRGDVVGSASDVYSLGVILYLLVCGRSPYDGADAAATPERIVCEFKPPRPSDAVSRFAHTSGPFGQRIARPPEAIAAARATSTAALVRTLACGVDDLVSTAIAKSPSRRFLDAAEMLEAIDAYLEEGSATALVETVAATTDVGPEITEPSSGDGAADQSRSASRSINSVSKQPTIRPEWGHLQIIDKLGEGMFGEVFKCRDASLETTVALKLNRTRIKDADASSEIAARALREGRLLARVKHRNVVRVLGAAVHDATVGIWMEYIEGQHLEHVLQQHGPLSDREIGSLGIDLCAALVAVHAEGVVHRDLKAQNVIRETSGRVVLTDFGSGLDLASRSTAVERAAGTPLYMAPEVLGGGSPTVKSDIYSLGVLLFRMATGSFPVEAESWDELINKQQGGQISKVRDVRPDVRPAIARVIDRALALDPRERYATAGEMSKELESAVTPADVRWWLMVAATAGGAAAAAVGFFMLAGALSSVVFQTSLAIPEDLVDSSAGAYLFTGFQAMVPATVSIALCLFAIWCGFRAIRRLRGEGWQLAPETGSVSLARGILMLGIAGIVGNIFLQRDLWVAIIALFIHSYRDEADLTLLSNAARQYGNEWAYAAIAAAMLAGMYAVWCRARERGDGGNRLVALQVAISATAALATLIAAMGWKLLVEAQPTFMYQPAVDAPHRWLDPEARRGDLKGSRAFVVGRNESDVWLYFPEFLYGMRLDSGLVEDPPELDSIFAYGAGTKLDR